MRERCTMEEVKQRFFIFVLFSILYVSVHFPVYFPRQNALVLAFSSWNETSKQLCSTVEAYEMRLIAEGAFKGSTAWRRANRTRLQANSIRVIFSYQRVITILRTDPLFAKTTSITLSFRLHHSMLLFPARIWQPDDAEERRS